MSFIDDDEVSYVDSDEDGYERSLTDFDVNQYSSGKSYSTPSLEWEQHEENYLSEIAYFNNHYPEQLKSFLYNGFPEKLFCMGNLSLFKKQIIMICGSRNSSEKGLKLAYKCGRLVAEQGYTVASGYARGVDMAAHLGALESGGDTIAIVPYGLLKFRVKNAMSEAFDIDRFLAVSELPPLCPFTVGNALRRNKLLVALSNAVIVIEPGETGGTWHSAECARKMSKPLYFHEGIRHNIITKLESMGGERLKVIRGAPDLKVIYEKIG